MSSKNNHKYDISIVIPVYNAENYLNQCVDSLINQTYDFSKIEVLLINDGSMDKSLEICNKYKEEHDNIYVFDQKNSGVSTARNVGIKNATGKYIMLLDSDDFISNNAISDLITFFNKHYDEIDLVTYPIYWYKNGRSSIHARYKSYDKGTGIYDLEEYIHLNQNTINIVTKNYYEDNVLFDKNMFLSEDQNYNTEILMKKKKLGFVESAIYYYRKVGTGVSDIKNNPYFCFEDIVSYNENLLKKYENDKVIPKYVQSLVIHTLNWRLNKDELFPYSYKGKEYENAKKRVFDMIKKIDAQVIATSTTLSVYNKIYFLESSGRKLELSFSNNILTLMCNDDVIYENDSIKLEVTKFKEKNDNLNIYACLMTPFFDFTNIDLYMKTTYRNNKVTNEEISLIKSNRLIKKCSEFEAHTYNINLDIDTKKVKKINLYAKIGEDLIPIEWKFNRFTSGNIVSGKNLITYNKKNFSINIKKSFVINKAYLLLKNDLRTLKNNRVAFAYRVLSKLYLKQKPVYLYNDRNNIIDNAYYQFKHDIKINDNIDRYYVTSMNDKELKANFTEEERKHIIKYLSLKHKLMFLKCKKIYTSFVDLQIYCPFNKGITNYKDLKKYDLIYLQHGILHANLVSMYSKEFKEIDKFVISSKFEEENLKNNYNYLESDFIKSTMPRMGTEKIEKSTTNENKILFAPSWRKYLIGESVKGERDLMVPLFLKTSFYKNINDFLKSKEFNELLEKEDLKLEFKLHPILEGYKNLFYVNDRIKISFADVNLDDYKIFITDFSSFQFDYVKLNKPIIYYLPDEAEFKAGMHTYRELDLKYEDAFGNLCTDANSLIKEIKKIIDNNYKVEKKYNDRMSNFFYKVDAPCKVIYEETKE